MSRTAVNRNGGATATAASPKRQREVTLFKRGYHSPLLRAFRFFGAPAFKVTRLLLLLLLAGAAQAATIKNPYYTDPDWAPWITPGMFIFCPADIEPSKLLYPDDSTTPNRFLEYRTSDWPDRKYAGFWDDVYSTWDGGHSNMPQAWWGADGNTVNFDGRLRWGFNLDKSCGANFTSQSTLGMGDGVANYDFSVSLLEQLFYFANVLRAGPAYISYQEDQGDQMTDLYQALVPSYYNSLGASGTEVWALKKRYITGGLGLAPQTSDINHDGRVDVLDVQRVANAALGGQCVSP